MSGFRQSLRFLPLRKSFLVAGQVRWLKEIRYTEKGDTTIIEGVQVKSPHEGKVVKGMGDGKACPLCKLGLKNLMHTDVLILSQFIHSNGEMIPQYVTGLCTKQHRRIAYLVKQAQKAGLLPRTPDQIPHGPWELNNTYFKTVYNN